MRRRQAMRKRAYASSRSMTWERTAERYLAAFESARRGHRLRVIARPDQSAASRDSRAPPEMQIGHFLSMCDDTGLFQHAVHSVPDRSHGYCVDDNARALLVACALNDPGEQRLSEALTARLAAFVQHAWNPDTRRFRNFMSFDRRWLEDERLGRQPWADALGPGRVRAQRCQSVAAAMGRAPCSPKRCRRWRAFARRAPGPSRCSDWTPIAPRSRRTRRAERVRHRLADRLMSILSAVETEDWVWFEEGLAYDNARLPQALIVTGMATGAPAYVEAGLEIPALAHDAADDAGGLFRPVGTESFGDKRQPPQAFDQQPLEATATISACLAAWRADGDAEWKADAARAFAWFLGSNDLSVPLVDLETGSCRDGLHPDRANENRGGESVVSYLLGLAEMRQLGAHERTIARSSRRFERVARLNSSERHSTSRGRLVTSHVPEPAGSSICAPIRRGSSCGRSSRRPNRATSIPPTRRARTISSTGSWRSIPRRQPASWPMCSRTSRVATATCSRRSRRAPTRWKTPLPTHAAFTKVQRQLVGAYFLHEYSFEAAALFNPSIVAHPDQSGAPDGRASLHPQPARGRRRACLLPDVPIRIHRGRWQRDASIRRRVSRRFPR